MIKKHSVLLAIALSAGLFAGIAHAQETAVAPTKTTNSAKKLVKMPTGPTQRLAFLHKRRAALIVRLQVINALVKQSKNLVKRLAFMGQRKRITALAQKLNTLIAKAELALA